MTVENLLLHSHVGIFFKSAIEKNSLWICDRLEENRVRWFWASADGTAFEYSCDRILWQNILLTNYCDEIFLWHNIFVTDWRRIVSGGFEHRRMASDSFWIFYNFRSLPSPSPPALQFCHFDWFAFFKCWSSHCCDIFHLHVASIFGICTTPCLL